MGYELYFEAIKKTDASYLVSNFEDYVRRLNNVSNRFDSKESKLSKSKTYKFMLDKLNEKMWSQGDDVKYDLIEKELRSRKKVQRVTKKSKDNFKDMLNAIGKLHTRYCNVSEGFSNFSGSFSKSSVEIALIMKVLSEIPRYRDSVYWSSRFNKFLFKEEIPCGFVIFEDELKQLRFDGKLDAFSNEVFDFFISLYNDVGKDKTIIFNIF